MAAYWPGGCPAQCDIAGGQSEPNPLFRGLATSHLASTNERLTFNGVSQSLNRLHNIGKSVDIGVGNIIYSIKVFNGLEVVW